MNGFEHQILGFWKTNKTFEQQNGKLSQKKRFNYFDGPPYLYSTNFHAGTALVSYIKDTICRYQRMLGNYIYPSFGYDCNGVPIEMKEMTNLKLNTKSDILAFGVNNFNQSCKTTILNCCPQFTDKIERLGRFIDTKNKYMTMDTNYKESVIWGFKQLFDQGLVYRGFCVVPYSIGMTTSLSNFEATQNYREVDHLSLIVKFPVDIDTYILVWTTTPWTLLANQAICTHPEMIIYKVIYQKEIYYLSRYKFLQLKNNNEYHILETLTGRDLKDLPYFSPFNYYQRAFKIVLDNYVEETTGTGFVHLAPAFGTDDFRICVEHQIIDKSGKNLVNPVDDEGKYTKDVGIWVGKSVIELSTQKEIYNHLNLHNYVFDKEMYRHNYPFCYRTDTPLIYMARSNFYIQTTKLKSSLLEHNSSVNWYPSSSGHQMTNWLVNNQDWCVSRNRFFGTPIPIWESSEGETLCFGSIQEIEQISQQKLIDLSKEYTDQISFMYQNKLYKSCGYVFDCWYESGSMPFAQLHYPFENKDLFQSIFPADIVCESSDQIHLWFYTLLVVSTALFKISPYKNVMVSGLITSETGEKLSKSKNNYTDPTLIVDRYGSDSMRLYLLKSPASYAETFKFRSVDIQTMSKSIICSWINSVQFFLDYSDQFRENLEIKKSILDKWILSKTYTFVNEITSFLNSYQLSKCVEVVLGYIENLTNWYIKLNRDVMKGKLGMDAQNCSLSILYKCLMIFTKTMNPLCPFTSEYLYQKLKREDQESSINFLSWEINDNHLINNILEQEVSLLQNIVNGIRYLRSRNKLSQKKPIQKITIIYPQIDVVRKFEESILNEGNICEIDYQSDTQRKCCIKPDMTLLKKKIPNYRMKPILSKIKNLTQEEIDNFRTRKLLEIEGYILTNELKITYQSIDDKTEYLYENLIIQIDLSWNEELQTKYYLKLICNKIQMLRKEMGLKQIDTVNLYLHGSSEIEEIIIKNLEYLKTNLSKYKEIYFREKNDSQLLNLDEYTLYISCEKIDE